MPLASFCNGASPEHASVPSDPRRRPRQAVVTSGDGIPFGTPSAGLSQARGRLAFRPRRPPPRRPLAAVDLPQPDRPEHPLSRFRVALRLEEQRCSTVLRCGPRYRTKPPGMPRLRSAHLVGPLSVLPRERRARRAAPEVPSTNQPPRLGGVKSELHLAVGSRAPTPFRPIPSATLTGGRRFLGSAATEHWNPGFRFGATAAP